MLHLVTDTVAGLPLDLLESLGVHVLVQYVNFGDEAYRDLEDLSPADFYARLAAAPELPRSSPAPVEHFMALFERILVEDYDAYILCIHPSAALSETVDRARTAARTFPTVDIRIFDTRMVGLPQGLMVLEAARLLESGAGIETIVQRLSLMRDTLRTLFVPDTLDYLYKGGRIGRARHLVGTVLDIKPVLTIRDGVVEACTQFMTHRRAYAGLRDLVLQEAGGRQGIHLGVTHAAWEDEARALAEELQAALHPEHFILAEMGPTLGANVGPGTLGVSWWCPPE